jgi:sterol desaturase/sphingolipid hydroxylase (fatty acid hydroxylase superfamily)
MLIEDTLFYWIHRLLHQPFLYKLIHKKHHEYTNTVSLAALYASPLEYIFSDVLPSAMGPILFGKNAHFATLLLWFIWRNYETLDGHCGYEFSWSPYRLIPLSGSSDYHNYHHSHNDGAYGSLFTYWDTLCGTN